MNKPHPRLNLSAHHGFSLSELLVAVAIIGILAGLMIDAGLRDWRRERVNTVVVELAGWLESVRRAALKGSSCQVSLTTTSGTLAGGATLATAADVGSSDAASSAISNNCRSAQPFQLTTLTANQAFRVGTRNTSGSFVFTPAGTLFPAPANGNPLEIRIALADGDDPQRCVQLDGLMGLISVGRVSNGSCDTNNRF